jgi:hypothetical protein
MPQTRYLSARGKPYADAPFHRFFEFIDPEADRYTILASLLDELKLNSVVLPIAGNRHFFIFPRGQSIIKNEVSSFPFRGQSPIILAAHYDRVPGSPGANDNRAAVFQLLKTALRLGEQGTNYWIIVFTDKEELGAGEGIRDQGSFGLAEYLRRGGLGDARVYIFDACGTGETLVVSSTTDYLLKNEESPGTRKARQLIQELRDHALDTARYLNLDKVLLVPTPFSDDAGFLWAGLPAQTLTMLPAQEAASFASLLRNRPDFANALISREIQQSADRFLIPETWRNLNSSSDSHLRLTPVHYDRVIRFAAALCSE